MEDLDQAFGGFYRGKRVLVTGHTGFKGAWLALWLEALGAEVTGFALPPEEPSLFTQLGLATRLDHRTGDIRDRAQVAALVAEKPFDVVLHLAAQPLVRRSYREPVETYATNVLGTVHVLEAFRSLPGPATCVVVTTDKCYENDESGRAFTESDRLGGHDPYSSSKACAEIAVSTYHRSFLVREERLTLASARAGNVIGAGDWAQDRIVPDAIRHLADGRAIPVRNPHATRPWQHVLEPLGGYLHLAATRFPGEAEARHTDLATFNFGPDPSCHRTVRDLVTGILENWPGAWEDQSDPSAVHEAGYLSLSIEKAARLLAWRPVWTFGRTLEETVAGYRGLLGSATPANACELLRSQIARYCADAARAAQPWSPAPAST